VVVTPGLDAAPFVPVLFLILAVCLVPLSYAVLVGTLAGIICQWFGLHQRTPAPQ
jgi:hypothetical protein